MTTDHTHEYEHDCTCESKEYNLDNKNPSYCSFSSSCKICGKVETVDIRGESATSTINTSPNPYNFITPHNFPCGQRILAYGGDLEKFGLFGVDTIEEYVCLEWSAGGRCKVLNALTKKAFWTTDNPNIRIVETFGVPSTEFSLS